MAESASLGGRDLIPAAVLAHVPGFRRRGPIAPIEELAGGSVNRSFRITTPAGRFVVRYSDAVDAWLSTDRSVERRLQALAAAAGIAPPILYCDSHGRWLITPFVAGCLWSESRFADAVSLGRLADVLRTLHGLPPPRRASRDVLETLREYARRIDAGGGETADLVRLLDTAARLCTALGASGRRPAIVHHDLNGANVIDCESTHRPVLIDWECAAVADPLLDVACLLSYHPQASPHSDLLLARTGLASSSRAELSAAIWLFELHSLLWYRERRLRRTPTLPERQAEAELARRLAAPTGLD